MDSKNQSYDIQLTVPPLESDEIPVLVKSKTHQPFNLFVSREDTVEDVKNKIEDKIGIESHFQRIKTQGINMNDDDTIGKHGLEADSVLELDE